MNKKINNISKIAITNALALGTILSPVSVMAQEGSELVKSREEGYGFTYKKNHRSDVSDKPSYYALKLRKGLTNTGKEFEPTKEQIGEASIMFGSKNGTEKAYSKYDGIYELYNVQREPGMHSSSISGGGSPVMESNMHLDKEDYGFEFPQLKDALNVEQGKVGGLSLKESEFLKDLELILQNEVGAGLHGEFELVKIANPLEVYGLYTKNEMEEFFGSDISVEGYNTPSTKEEKNTVKSWIKLDEEEHIGNLKTYKNAENGLIEDGEWGLSFNYDKDVQFASDMEKELTEGIYVLRQKSAPMGYMKRPDVHFAITLNNKNKGILKFLEDINNLNVLDDEFDEKYKLHDNEQFLSTNLDDGGGDEGDATFNTTEIAQALFVNYPLPGFKPLDPNDPNGNDGDDGKDIKSEFQKEIERSAELNESFKEYKEAVVDRIKGDSIKVNIGEKFKFTFDLLIPSNIEEYEKFEFQDYFDNAINIDGVERKSIKVYDGNKDITSNIVDSVDKEGRDLRVRFNPSNMSSLKNKSIKIIIEDVYIEKGTIENVKNKGFIHYKVNDEVKTPDVPLGTMPDIKDLINPEDPMKVYGDNSKDIDPENIPTISTTPEVVIDPINVDFRMGVVNSGTTLLNDAKYLIKDFVPARGDGGLTEDGKIRVGEVVYDIDSEIDAGEGFLKLENLPAGKYLVSEVKSPLKDDEEYRLVTANLVFVVHEDEKHITIENPIVKNKDEIFGNTIDAESLYRDGENSTVRNELNWNNSEVNKGEAMLHHYKYIDTPETGTLAGVPFFLGGGVLVSTGIVLNKRKKK